MSIFKGLWFDKGIHFVCNLLDNTGEFLQFDEFIGQFQVNITQREFIKVCKAIPLHILGLIQNTLLYCQVVPTFPSLQVNDLNLLDKKNQQ
jgi:hypothetical protein